MEPLRVDEVLVGHQHQDDYYRCKAGLQIHQYCPLTRIRLILSGINNRPMNHSGVARMMMPTKRAKMLKARMGFTGSISLS
jgi:hypothetical protein